MDYREPQIEQFMKSKLKDLEMMLLPKFWIEF